MEQYNIEMDSWKEISRMDSSKAALCLVTLGDKLYLYY
jgi:hypothetical protein